MKTQTNDMPKIEVNKHLQKHWTEQERTNVEIVLDFFQALMNAHDFDYVLSKYTSGSYIQHNRAIANEISGVVDYIKTLTKSFPEYSFDVKKVYADGDFVILHSHATMHAKHRGNEKKGFIITDTFRLQDAKLAEHWDAIQAIDLFSRFIMLMTGGKLGNTNPTF